MDNHVLLKKLRGEIGEGSDPMTTWSHHCFVNSKTRYLDDLNRIEKYYKTGKILDLGAAPFTLPIY